jgi:hypothetical protein
MEEEEDGLAERGVDERPFERGGDGDRIERVAAAAVEEEAEKEALFVP